MKDVIYLDVLLLTNFLCAYFLLLAAGRLTGQRAGFGRLVLGAAAAAASALILFAPELGAFWQFAYRLGTALLIVAAAYGARGKRRYAAAVLWYTAFNLLLAGAAILYVQRTGAPTVQTANLAVYVRVSPLLLITLCALCCTAVYAVQWALVPADAPPKAAGFEVVLCETPLHLRAMLDTGCRLRDPMAGLPVLLVSYPDAYGRLPGEIAAFLKAWFSGLRKSQPPPGVRLRMIPCQTATGRGLLPGFAVPHIGLITAEGVLDLGPAAVAFSPQSVGGDAYEALYGPDLLPPHSRRTLSEEEKTPWN